LFTNPGVIALEFAFKFPKDDEDEPELWVDRDLLSADELTQDLILENKLFVVEPRSASLAPGESVLVTMKYVHKFATARFVLPVVLQVKNGLPCVHSCCDCSGKQVVLRLIGKTLEPQELLLAIPAPQGPFTEAETPLRPVLLGDTSPPAQFVEVHNSGTQQLSVTLDTSPIEAFNDDNYGFPVLSLLSSSELTLSPNSSGFYKFLFRPIEAKTYSLTLPLAVYGSEAPIMNLVGAGVQSDSRGVEDDVVPVPSYPLIVPPRQSVFVAVERLVFSSVPTLARCSQFVTLRNRSPNTSFEFEVDLSGDIAGAVLDVRPSHGVIVAEGVEVLRVTLCSNFETVADFDVPIRIMPHVVNALVEEDLNDDDDNDKSSAGAARKDGPRLVSTKGHVSVIGRTLTRSVNKAAMKKTLNGLTGMTIGSDRGDASPRSVASRSTAAKSMSSKASRAQSSGRPESNASKAPNALIEEPFDATVFLGVFARVRPYDEQERLHHNSACYFIPRAVSDSSSNAAAAAAMASRTRSEAPVGAADMRVMAEGVLSSLLSDLMRDHTVRATLDQLDETPALKYVQMTSRPPTPFLLAQPLDKPEGGHVKEGGEGGSRSVASSVSSRHVIAMGEFVNLAHYVIDGCIFNLLSEVRSLFFSLTAPGCVWRG
jgi:hypothetical protein